MIKYKRGKDNVVSNALSHRHNLISTMVTKMMGFEHIRELYKDNVDFGVVYALTYNARYNTYCKENDYLYFDGRLHVPKCSSCELFVR